MYFAQFYHLSTGYPTYKEEDKTLIPACGDRSVYILDGRASLANMMQTAYAEAQKRGYLGYTLHKGESFTREKQISEFVPVEPIKLLQKRG